jgi:hypothetical protein
MKPISPLLLTLVFPPKTPLSTPKFEVPALLLEGATTALRGNPELGLAPQEASARSTPPQTAKVLHNIGIALTCRD